MTIHKRIYAYSFCVGSALPYCIAYHEMAENRKSRLDVFLDVRGVGEGLYRGPQKPAKNRLLP